MSRPDEERAKVLEGVRRDRDVVPCVDRLLTLDDVYWRLLPPGMLQLLCTSPDFVSPVVGAPPVTLQLSSGDAAAELVLYRALGDDLIYMLAPGQD